MICGRIAFYRRCLNAPRNPKTKFSKHEKAKNLPYELGSVNPVGAGKTTLTAALARGKNNFQWLSLPTISTLRKTRKHAHADLPEDRVIGVETGGCPHTAIRERIN